MINQDDNLSIDEDFEDSQVLHPSLVRTATPVATNDSRKTKARVASAATGTGTQRGRAWREKDSILLVQAFEWVEENRKGTTFFNYILMKDWESQPIQDDKMYQRWLSLDPEPDFDVCDCTLERHGLYVQVLL